MAKNVYRARVFAQFSHQDAQKIGERLEKLGREITPALVLEDARHKDSPLHPYFEWDDSVAAERYRLKQAGLILNHIEIVVEDDATLPAYYNLKIDEVDKGRKYVPLHVIEKDAGLRRQLLDSAWRELESWRSRYASYRKHFRPVFQVIDQTLNGRKTGTRG